MKEHVLHYGIFQYSDHFKSTILSPFDEEFSNYVLLQFLYHRHVTL